MVPHVTESFPNLRVLRSQSLQQQLIDTFCSNQRICLLVSMECHHDCHCRMPTQFLLLIISFPQKMGRIDFSFLQMRKERDHMKRGNLLLIFYSNSRASRTGQLPTCSSMIQIQCLQMQRLTQQNVRKNQVKIKCQELLIL